MGENELLLRQAENWASTKNRTMDGDLLATALGVWCRQEGRAAREWPAGSAERLLLQEWRAHERVRESRVGVLVASLDTFWRFLRATGRMRSGSAEPKDLAKEARRAVPKMVAAGSARAQHTPMTVREALEEWPGDVLERDEDDFFDDEDFCDEDFFDDEDFTHDETWALLPGPHDGWVLNQPVHASARDARESPFTQECLRFARWIGDGKSLTNGVLGAAHVWEASVEFDLIRWQLEFLTRSPLLVSGRPESPGLGDLLPDGRLGQLDHFLPTRALESLWQACLSAGLIEVSATTVRATSAAEAECDRSPHGWALLGSRLAMSAVTTRHFLEPLDPVLRVLLPFLTEDVDRVGISEVKDWWWQHDANPWTNQGLGATQARTASDRQAERLLWALGDTGIWRQDGATLHRTALGVDVALALIDDLSWLLDAS